MSQVRFSMPMPRLKLVVEEVLAPNLIILVVMSLFVLWAALLLVPSYNAGDATPTSYLVSLCGTQTAAAITLIGVILASLLALSRPIGGVSLMLLAPQQSVLAIAAAASIKAIVVAHYADGVIRDRGFLAADQVPIILLFFTHSLVLGVLIMQWVYRGK